jgi:hypothetical protein
VEHQRTSDPLVLRDHCRWTDRDLRFHSSLPLTNLLKYAVKACFSPCRRHANRQQTETARVHGHTIDGGEPPLSRSPPANPTEPQRKPPFASRRAWTPADFESAGCHCVRQQVPPCEQRLSGWSTKLNHQPVNRERFIRSIRITGEQLLHPVPCTDFVVDSHAARRRGPGPVGRRPLRSPCTRRVGRPGKPQRQYPAGSRRRSLRPTYPLLAAPLIHPARHACREDGGATALKYSDSRMGTTSAPCVNCVSADTAQRRSATDRATLTISLVLAPVARLTAPWMVRRMLEPRVITRCRRPLGVQLARMRASRSRWVSSSRTPTIGRAGRSAGGCWRRPGPGSGRFGDQAGPAPAGGLFSDAPVDGVEAQRGRPRARQIPGGGPRLRRGQQGTHAMPVAGTAHPGPVRQTGHAFVLVTHDPPPRTVRGGRGAAVRGEAVLGSLNGNRRPRDLIADYPKRRCAAMSRETQGMAINCRASAFSLRRSFDRTFQLSSQRA